MIEVKLKNKINEVIKKYKCKKMVEIESIYNNCYNDLVVFSKKDPSSKGSAEYILESYNSYWSVLCYRIAHSVNKSGNFEIARKISEDCKSKTGIEIHPSAKIGEKFVIDHGIGTVIGETTVIGNNCYLLQSIVLGAEKIANNKMENRHPILGDNVEIGGFSRIIGAIKIGDNTKIAPYSLVRRDIPKDSSVLSLGMIQIIKNNKQSTIKFNGYLKQKQETTLYFEKIQNKFSNITINDVKIIKDIILTELGITIKNRDNNQIENYKINFSNNEEFILTI